LRNLLTYVFPVRRGTAKIHLAVFLLVISFTATAQNPVREYRFKAVFLFNFTKFVEWPASSFDSPEAPFIIGILGDDPFGSVIDETVASEKVKGHPIVIQRYKQLPDIEHCHLLFISAKEIPVLKDKMQEIQRHILTVGDSPDFNIAGGMIRLTTRDNKIKLIINPSAVKAAELNMSSKLLKVAEIFDTPR